MASIRVMQLLTPLTIAGAERVVLSLLKHVDAARFDMGVVIFRAEHTNLHGFFKELETIGLAAAQIPLRRLFEWKQVSGLIDILRREKVDILHTHSHRADVSGFLAARVLGLPVVSTVHGWTPSSGRLRLYEFVDRRFLRFFDRVIAVSDEIGANLVSYGLRPERVVKISNAVEVERFAYRNGDRPAERTETVVGTVGRLSVEKGLSYFLRAAREILSVRDDVRFLLVGDGPQREELTQLARSLRIEDRVRFVGHIDDPAAIYSALDIFVLPSLSEGMPISLLEAFAAGRPCVATSVGGVVELLGRDGLGLMVPPADAKALAKAILSLLNSPSLAAEMARRARQQVVAEHSPGPWARQVEQVYLSLKGI